MNERIAKTLEEARLLMANGHWCRGRNYDHGKYCLRGAILQVTSGQPERMSPLARGVFLHLIRFLPQAAFSLTYFNDQPKRTWEEVDALLARAAEAARQP